MDDFKQPNKYSWMNKAAVFAVALILTVAIIIQGNFLEGLLKFLGVGASQIERISITSVDDFRGVAGSVAVLEGGHNQPVFVDTAPFSFFTGQPVDPGVTSGFIMPLVAIGDPLRQITLPSSYISPIIDAGEDALDNVLQSIEVLDYQPVGIGIIYKYRVSNHLSDLLGKRFQILDMSAVDTNEEFTQRQAIVGTDVPRYLQFEVLFEGGFTVRDRPMVAQIDIVHGPEDMVVLDLGLMDEPQVTFDSPAWLEGDFNNDGKVNSLDFAIFLQKFTGDNGGEE